MANISMTNDVLLAAVAAMHKEPGRAWTAPELVKEIGDDISVSVNYMGQVLRAGADSPDGPVRRAGRGKFELTDVGRAAAPAKAKAAAPKKRAAKAAPAPKGKPDAPPARAKPAPVAVAPAGQGNTRSVQLRSGGTLTVTVSTNVLDLDAEDRAFVFGLVDAIAGYGR